MMDKELYSLKEDWKKCALDFKTMGEMFQKELILMSSFLDKIADEYPETDPVITEFLDNRGLEWERIKNIVKEKMVDDK